MHGLYVTYKDKIIDIFEDQMKHRRSGLVVSHTISLRPKRQNSRISKL